MLMNVFNKGITIANILKLIWLLDDDLGEKRAISDQNIQRFDGHQKRSYRFTAINRPDDQFNQTFRSETIRNIKVQEIEPA